jgi:hypothetical protein
MNNGSSSPFLTAGANSRLRTTSPVRIRFERSSEPVGNSPHPCSALQNTMSRGWRKTSGL